MAKVTRISENKIKVKRMQYDAKNQRYLIDILILYRTRDAWTRLPEWSSCRVEQWRTPVLEPDWNKAKWMLKRYNKAWFGVDFINFISGAFNLAKTVDLEKLNDLEWLGS